LGNIAAIQYQPFYSLFFIQIYRVKLEVFIALVFALKLKFDAFVISFSGADAKLFFEIRQHIRRYVVKKILSNQAVVAVAQRGMYGMILVQHVAAIINNKDYIRTIFHY